MEDLELLVWVEMTWGVKLGVGGGGGGVDLREGADVSGAGDDDGRGLDGGFITVSPGFPESSGKTSQTVSNSFQYLP